MTRVQVRAVPMLRRWAATGAGSAGVVGGVVGLVVGLRVHPPTAWFAIFELGVPASFLGGLAGLASGAVAYAVGRKRGGATSANPEADHLP